MILRTLAVLGLALVSVAPARAGLVRKKGTPLEEAILAGDARTAKDLYKKEGRRADLDAYLSIAASTGNPALIRFFVESGAKPSIRTLCAAAGATNLQAVEYLVGSAGVAASGKCDGNGETPLMRAAWADSPDIVRYLLDRGSDARAVTTTGESALQNAKSAAVAELLIKKGADVNAHTAQGVTPLAEAIGRERPEVARALLEAGADAKVLVNERPAILTAARHRDAETVRRLLEHGAAANAADEKGATAMAFAIDNPALAEVLLAHGADVNSRSLGGDWTVLGCIASACTGGAMYEYGREDQNYADVARALAEHGADLNVRDQDGCTPLQAASSTNHLDVARVLVENGADVNAKPCLHSRHPLQAAVARGQLDLIRLLLEAGSTEAPPEYAVCSDFHPNGLIAECPRAKIVALLANPPAPILRLAQISKDMSAMKRAQAASAPAASPAQATAAPKSDADEPRYHSTERPHDLAVVVGIERYGGELPEAPFAEHDARVVRDHLLALGYPARNIFLLTGSEATRSGLVKNLETRLPALAKPDSTVFFYYSGHGAPDAATGKAYLLPVDGDPQFLKDTAYPLAQLYAALGRLPAQRVIVALDSCFSGAGRRSVIAKGTRPLVTKFDDGGALPGNVVALTASSGSQTSGVIDAQGHGAFTYYLLRGLNGAAKDDSGQVTVKSLFDYLGPNVEDAARRENRDQAPQFLTSESARGRRIPLR